METNLFDTQAFSAGILFSLAVMLCLLLRAVTQDDHPVIQRANRLALAVAWENGNYSDYDQAIPLGSISGSTLEGLYKEMADYWAGILKISPAMISLDSHFIFDLGGDSLGLIDLIHQLEKANGIKMNTDQIRNYLTLKEMTNYVQTL